jgi:hypothetical protein
MVVDLSSRGIKIKVNKILIHIACKYGLILNKKCYFIKKICSK